MLSSQTKDETTFEAMTRLKAQTLSPSSIKDIPIGDLEKLLHPVSFYKVYTKTILKTDTVSNCTLFFIEQGQVSKANRANID